MILKTHQNWQNEVKTCLEGNIFLNINVKKINQLSNFHFKKLERDQIKPKQGKRNQKVEQKFIKLKLVKNKGNQ